MVYTCPLHPQISQKEPGNCPLCGMSLKSRSRSLGHLSLYALCILTLAGIYFFQRLETSFLPKTLEGCIEKMLPEQESLVAIEKMKGGFANAIWQVYTTNGHYILREKTKKVSASAFIRDLEMAKKAFAYGIGPAVIGFNTHKQQILLEYIDHIAWPTFEKNSEPYKKAMLALKTFHEKMPSHLRIDRKSYYAPFARILEVSKELLKTGELPNGFSVALERLNGFFEELEPWLKERATLCHGDFCKANVLLSEEYSPRLIDFDSVSIGDPFLDVVKFSLSLHREARLELLEAYLERSPSLEEVRHFEIMDLSLLMLISTSRLKSLRDVPLNEKLSKAEMEGILEMQEPIPSFQNLPYENASAKVRQTAAILALAEFLKRSETLEKL